MAAKKILIVEDDRNLTSALQYSFVKEGYNVIVAADGAEALEVARREKPDLLILDLMLPKISGFEVCRILRREMTLPILMLTARDDETDKVVGLDMGADDYMTKPFGMRELLARVRAMLRRTEMRAPGAVETAPLKVGAVEVDPGSHTATKGGSPLILTPKEFDLLTFLARNQGLVFSREQLLEKVWGYDYAGDSRTIDVHVRWLREKIEDNPEKPQRLVTVRGVGYKLEPAARC